MFINMERCCLECVTVQMTHLDSLVEEKVSSGPSGGGREEGWKGGEYRKGENES